jgi:hypothetical protein
MRRALTDQEFEEHIFDAQRYAWRWEQQPHYWIGYEQDKLDAFLAGAPEIPDDNPDMVAWLDQIRKLRAAGVLVGRVRVIEEPPTDYQRWLLWMDRWNTAAGEEIHYLPRWVLQQMGRPPFAPTADWWLIDGERLLIMNYAPDGSGRRIPPGTRTGIELIADEPEVHQARLWRLAAISWAREEETVLSSAA